MIWMLLHQIEFSYKLNRPVNFWMIFVKFEHSDTREPSRDSKDKNLWVSTIFQCTFVVCMDCL